MRSKTIAVIGKNSQLSPYRYMFFALARIFGYEVLQFEHIEPVMHYSRLAKIALLLVFADSEFSAQIEKIYKRWKEHPLAVWVCLSDQKVEMPDVKTVSSRASLSYLIRNINTLYAQSLSS